MNLWGSVEAPRVGGSEVRILLCRMLFRHGCVFSAKQQRARAGCLVAVVLVMACAGTPDAYAQFATVRGRVIDSADGQPLPGAAVVLRNQDDGRQTGTAADGNGYFVLARVPPGTYQLTVSFVGYQPFTDTLALAFEDSRALDIPLELEEAELEEVVVESQRETTARATAGFASIRPPELARIPTPGGSPDLAGYLQTQPGVVVTGDRGGQLFVRGGTPTQNLVLIDGMPVFQPFHIVGFYSAFPADIMAYADVYAGGFGARYGGRLSSVINVATRNGNKRRLTGATTLAPFLGALRLEIPVVPDRVSLLASIRESIIERIAPDLLGTDLPYRFGDRFVKLHAFLNRTSSLSLTALSTYDAGDVANAEGRPTEIGWRNQAFGFHYVYLPEDFAALTQLRLYHSRLENRYQPFGTPRRESTAQAYGMDLGFIYFLGPTEVHLGLFGTTYAFLYDLGTAREVEEFVTEGGMYVDVPVEAGTRFRVVPGLRLHSFPSRSEVTLEPRLRAEWHPGGAAGRHVFSAAWGIYHQQIIGLYNARDVTDAFVTWTPSPVNEPVPQAMHILAGWQGQVRPWLRLGVEGYVKLLEDLAFAEYDESFDDEVRVDPVDGTARGVDVTLEIMRSAFYGSVSYGLALVRYERQVERHTVVVQDDGSFILVPRQATERFSPAHDRRHQVNALLRVERGPYAAGVRWQFGSGLPFTPATGFYDHVAISEPDDAFHTAPGSPRLVTEPDLYAGRLPAYHRLDVSFERRFTIGVAEATVQAAVINVYDRANLFDYDLFAGQRINQLPLIPSLGLNVAWR